MTQLARILCITTAILGSGFSGARAQDTLATTEILRQYEAQKKNAAVAAVLEYTFPFVGYAYAGNWRRGLAPGGMALGGFLLLAPCAYTDLGPCSDNQQIAALAGITLIVASRIWGAVGASHTATDHNRTLRQRLQIEPGRTPDGFALGVRLRL